MPTDVVPPKPISEATPGSVEAAARKKVPEAHKVGFDVWMQEIRSSGDDPNAVLGKIKPDRIRTIAAEKTIKFEMAVQSGIKAERVRARAKDDPLRPILERVERDGNITLHYETEAQKPSKGEIALGKAIARATGEEVHLFGDTASKLDYPGIDGTIGTPPRPLQLKAGSANAPVNWARHATHVALEKARLQGYSELEVQISLPGKTVAEVKAGWDLPGSGPTAQPVESVYDGNVVAKLTIRCKDGVWNPPKGTARTGVPLIKPLPEPDGERRRR